MRSSPVIASVSCVPIATIWKTGAISSTKNALNASHCPAVIVPFAIACPPNSYIRPPTMPIIVTPDKLINEVAVIVFRMLSSNRSTPAAKI